MFCAKFQILKDLRVDISAVDYPSILTEKLSFSESAEIWMSQELAA